MFCWVEIYTLALVEMSVVEAATARGFAREEERAAVSLPWTCADCYPRRRLTESAQGNDIFDVCARTSCFVCVFFLSLSFVSISLWF